MEQHTEPCRSVCAGGLCDRSRREAQPRRPAAGTGAVRGRRERAEAFGAAGPGAGIPAWRRGGWPPRGADVAEGPGRGGCGSGRARWRQRRVTGACGRRGAARVASPRPARGEELGRRSERGEAGGGSVGSGVLGPSLSLGSEGLGEGGGERRCEPRDRLGSVWAGSGRRPVRAGRARRRSLNLKRPACSRGVRSGARVRGTRRPVLSCGKRAVLGGGKL